MSGNCLLLDIHVNEPVTDKAGQPVTRWRKIGQEYFEFVAQAGGESRRGDQIEASITHQAVCRYFAGAKSGMRLVRGERVFEVASVVNRGEQNKFLDWQLAEVVR